MGRKLLIVASKRYGDYVKEMHLLNDEKQPSKLLSHVKSV